MTSGKATAEFISVFPSFAFVSWPLQLAIGCACLIKSVDLSLKDRCRVSVDCLINHHFCFRWTSSCLGYYCHWDLVLSRYECCKDFCASQLQNFWSWCSISLPIQTHLTVRRNGLRCLCTAPTFIVWPSLSSSWHPCFCFYYFEALACLEKKHPKMLIHPYWMTCRRLDQVSNFPSMETWP